MSTEQGEYRYGWNEGPNRRDDGLGLCGWLLLGGGVVFLGMIITLVGFALAMSDPAGFTCGGG